MLLHPPAQPLDQVAPLVFLWVVAYGSLSIGFAWGYRLDPPALAKTERILLQS